MTAQGRTGLRGSIAAAQLVCVCVCAGCFVVRGQRYADFVTPTPLALEHTLVIGFLGGRDKWNDDRRGTRKLALKLRGMKLPGVQVETVENKERELAIELVRNALDCDRDGKLNEEEKKSARIIMYGQSFGGAAVNKVARELKVMGVPVLLTVQVDSVGRGDGLVPSNVTRAANFYQRDGFFIRGEKNFRAEDPTKTTILGNFEYSYRGKKINVSHLPWYQRTFLTAHAKMDSDPQMWEKVEAMILGGIRK